METKRLRDTMRSADKLDGERIRSKAYSEAIIREQESLIETANNGIEKINSDLKALKVRLSPYVGASARPMDEKGDELRFRYIRRLQERNALEKARVIAEESIAASRLNMIPGETTSTPKAPNSKGYNGLEV